MLLFGDLQGSSKVKGQYAKYKSTQVPIYNCNSVYLALFQRYLHFARFLVIVTFMVEIIISTESANISFTNP